MEGKSFRSPTENQPGAPNPIPRLTHRDRSQPHSRPLSVPAGHVKFRILCLVSRVGAVIGIRGSLVKQIQQSTESKIWVEDARLGSPDRVITVIAEGGSTSRVKLAAGYGDKEEEGEEEVEVSKAQYALIRVFEVLNDGYGTGTVSCRLLMDASHVGPVKGKGIRMVERIRKETRCKVEIWKENLPICADPDDALVEIEGNVLAVKKALVSVSRRLQACQQICKTRMVPHDALLRTMEREALCRSSDVSQGDVLRQHREVDPRESLHRAFEIGQRTSFPPDEMETVTKETLSQPMINFLSRRGSALDTHPHSITASASKKHPVTIEQPLSESDVSVGDLLRQQKELLLRYSSHRHFEIGQRDALGIPLGSLPPDAYQRRDEISRHGTVQDTNLHSITASRSKNHPVTIEQPLSESDFDDDDDDYDDDYDDDDYDNENIVLKILCPTESAGGPGGSNIMTIERETGALIDVGDTPANCDECLITITSEIPDDRPSPAGRAILLVLSKLFEIFPRKIYKSDWILHQDSIGSRSFITARLVIPTYQIGCLLGSSEVWISFEASILLLAVDENPKCISANDHILQISGEFPTVERVIKTAISMLRSNILLNSGPFSATKGNATYKPGRISRGETITLSSMRFHPSPSLPRRSKDSLQRESHNPVNNFKPDDDTVRRLLSLAPLAPSQLRASPPPAAPRGAYDGSGGLSSTMADPGLDRGHEYQRTNTTVKIRVPEKAVNFVFGKEDGFNRLEVVTQISGATVIAHEPHPGTSDRIVAISGTPIQTKTAQRVLHAFIIVGESLSLCERIKDVFTIKH